MMERAEFPVHRKRTLKGLAVRAWVGLSIEPLLGYEFKWRPLARTKLQELDRVIAAARQMKSAIESGLRCGCIRIEDCLPDGA